MFTNRPALRQQEAPTPTTQPHNPVMINDLERDFPPIRDEVQKRLLADNKNNGGKDTEKLKAMIETTFDQVLNEKHILYNHSDRTQILEWVTADIVGYGPIEPLLRDPVITEVMINRHDQIFVEKKGLIEPVSVQFDDEAHLMRIIDRIVSPLGRRVDETSPMVDARLPNGYRINATIPPLSLDGPTLTIRKFSAEPLTVDDLIGFGSITEQLAGFLKACVEARVNMVVSGGTGSGKTSFLNLLSSFIPDNERVITIEDTAELKLEKAHVVRLEKRPPNIEGKGEITIRQLVVNALRMRPDRIVVGECRSSEAFDMLQAMNTGHDGSMTTIHSNGPRDTLRRIETMVLMAGMDLPLRAIREQVASSVELIVHLERMRDGSRKVLQISEVQGMESETIVMQDLFLFRQTGTENGKILGTQKATGLRPSFMEKFMASNIDIDVSMFTK